MKDFDLFLISVRTQDGVEFGLGFKGEADASACVALLEKAVNVDKIIKSQATFRASQAERVK